MTREEALAMYRPIRASVRRILSSAISVCNQSDLMRAAKPLGLWAGGKIVLPEDDEAAEMLASHSSSRTSAGGEHSIHSSAARHDNSMPPISHWANGWATRSFPCLDSARATRSPVFGSKTF